MSGGEEAVTPVKFDWAVPPASAGAEDGAAWGGAEAVEMEGMVELPDDPVAA